MDKMYYKLDQEELDYIKEISKKTMTDYEIKGDMFPMESMYSLLCDVICEIHRLEEQIEDLKQEKEQDTELY